MKNTTKKIETDRLILRKFKEDDYKPMYEYWASEEEVANGAGWPVHTDPEITKGLVKMWVDEYKEENVEILDQKSDVRGYHYGEKQPHAVFL